MILGITGSRSFQDDTALNRRASIDLFTNALALLKPTVIVHGGCRGPDIWANAWAYGRNVHSHVVLPDGHHASDYLARNRVIVLSGLDALLVCWDEKSGGTGYTYDFAFKEGIKCVTVPINRDELDGSESDTVRRYRSEWLTELL